MKSSENGPFRAEDVRQIEERGIGLTTAIEQIDRLLDPPAAIVLARPCTVGDGIERLDPEEQSRLEECGEETAANGRLLKFVPASGAASRMFKDLIAVFEQGSIPAVSDFFARLDQFPFAAELRHRAGSDADDRTLLRTLLHDMDYASRPKGLIPFHRFGDEVRTAFEEHLLESTRLVRDGGGICRAHFTVSPESLPLFREELARVSPAIEQRAGCRVDVSFSVQHPATDTLAVADDDGEPFRNSDGTLLFRPGGHGALLRNIHQLDADIVSIKNIDNILPDESNGEALQWKKILAGLLVEVQRETFAILEECADSDAPDSALERAIGFARRRFHRQPDSAIRGTRAAHGYIESALNRPIRVCGVVRNEGEPGGAPFWIRDEHDGESIQIVESSQVNCDDPDQARIWSSSTHFNPVDIVCGLRDWRGERFQLQRFVDPRAVFVSRKSHEGRELRALELPGLWNGAMAHWNTVCVEVPASTFAPVKTVFDLLRPQHQPRS